MLEVSSVIARDKGRDEERQKGGVRVGSGRTMESPGSDGFVRLKSGADFMCYVHNQV